MGLFMYYQLLRWYSGKRNLTYPISLVAGVSCISFNVIFLRCGRVCKWKWNALQERSVREHHRVLPVPLQWRLWGGSGWKDLCWWVLAFGVEKRCSKPRGPIPSETVEEVRDSWHTVIIVPSRRKQWLPGKFHHQFDGITIKAASDVGLLR